MIVNPLATDFRLHVQIESKFYLKRRVIKLPRSLLCCIVQSWEQLQNTPQLIYMSLNKNSVYCVMPRSSKPPDTCK